MDHGRKGFDLRQLNWDQCPGASETVRRCLAAAFFSGVAEECVCIALQNSDCALFLCLGGHLLAAAGCVHASSRPPCLHFWTGAVNRGLFSTSLGRGNNVLNGVQAKKDSPQFGGISVPYTALWVTLIPFMTARVQGFCV